MTTPNGHPDFQAYAQWRGLNLLPTFSDTLAAGTYTFGPFLMTQWSAVWIRAFVSSGNGTFKINWWADSGMTLGLGADTFPISANTSLQCSLPISGPYMEITITSGPVSPLVLNHWVTGSNNNPGRPIFPIVTDQVIDLARSVPASTVFNRSPGFIAGGWGYILFNPNDATQKLTVEVFQTDQSGVVTARIWGPESPPVFVSQQFIIPAQPTIVRITNTDAAAAHSYDLYYIITAST